MTNTGANESPAFDTDRLCRLLVESVEEYAIFLLNAAGKVVSSNAGARQVLGYNERGARGRHYLSFFPDELKDQVDLLDEAAAAGKSRREGWMLHANGVRTYCDAVMTALHEADSSRAPSVLHGYALVVRDASGRRALDASRRHSEERYRTLVDHFPNGAVFLFDRQLTCLLAAGQGLEAMGGVEAVGRSSSELWGADSVDLHLHLAREGHPGNFDVAIGEQYFQVQTLPLHTSTAGQTPGGDVEDPRAATVMLVAQDISERKRAEQEHLQLIREQAARSAAESARIQLRRARQRLDDILGNLPGVVWESWSDATPLMQRSNYVSDYLWTLLGYTAEEWLSAPNFWLSIVHPEDRAEAQRVATEQFMSGRGGINRFRWVARDGRVVWIEARTATVLDENGAPIGMRAVALDVTERHRTNERLMETNRTLEMLIESAPLAIYVIDQDGVVELWNQGVQKLSGYSAADAVGHRLPTVPPEQWPQFLEYLQTALRGETPPSIVWERMTKDGRRLSIEMWLARLDGGTDRRNALPSSKVRQEGRIMVISTDVTRRHAIETELRRSEERFRAAQELSLYAFAILNSVRSGGERKGGEGEGGEIVDFVFEYANPTAETMLGRRADRIVGHTLLELLPALREGDLFERYKRVVESGKGHDIEVRFEAPNGVSWLRNMAVKLGDGLAISASDITARRREQEKERFITEASGLLAASLDFEATVETVARLGLTRFASCCVVELSGSAGSADGEPHRYVIAHHDSDKEAQLRALGREEGGTAALGTLVARMLQDESRKHDLEGASVFDERLSELATGRGLGVPLRVHERSVGVLVFIRPKEAEPYSDEELELARALGARAAVAIENARLYREASAARTEAEAANRAKDEFLSVVSHELRTPLNAIAGWTHILRKEPLDEETTQAALEVVERNVKLQTQLVEDLLDVTRIMTGKLRLEVKPVDFGLVLGGAVDASRPALEGKKLHLSLQIDDETPPVQGDAHRLQQVIWNLLSNAIKFTPEGGTITIKLEALEVPPQTPDADPQIPDGRQALPARGVRLIVEDSGAGISGEFLPHVFQRFRQADSSTTRRYTGLGIGLAITQHLVQLHRGTIEARSEGPGRGATFIVELPSEGALSNAEHPNAERGIKSEVEERGAPLVGVAALVVDDEEDAGIMAITILNHYGATARYARGAAQALELLESWQPDILISDIGMAETDGYELLRHVRTATPAGANMPALALTAYARTQDRDRALDAGYNRHLAKPFVATDLLDAVRALMGRDGEETKKQGNKETENR